MDLRRFRLLLALLNIRSVAEAYGSTTVLAPMFSDFNETTPNSDSYFICVLQAGTLIPRCDGTIQVNSTYYGFPPVNTSFLALSAGGHFTCGLTFGPQLAVCWGEPDVKVPVEYQNVSYTDIASGGYHACGLRASGVADCWGRNQFGQATPPENTTFISLTCGDRFSCGIIRGSLQPVCWGYRAIGFYGLQMPKNERFTQLSAGAFHVCGILESNSTVMCWGSNKNEQSIPPAGHKFSQLSVGNDHSCGLLKETHLIECWGGNSKIPPELTSTPFTTLVAGDFYNCVVGLGMKVNCWGYARSATSRFASVKVLPSVCTTQNCKQKQNKLTGQQLCPEKQYQVCVDQLGASSHDVDDAKIKVLAPVALVVVCSAVVAVIAMYRRKRLARQKSYHREVLSSELHEWENQARRVEYFTKSQLQLATDNYSRNSTLGTGSFGVVYKGVFPDGKMVAIKKARQDNRIDSFKGELKLLTRLNHANLVNLIGYCEQENCLVFEYMANGSLYDCLFRKNIKLEWSTRLRIAAQAARGVEYLHIYAVPGVIHRDIKSSNILLDEDFNAHVADFGLSMLGPLGNLSHISNTTLVGTPGYLDPEYFQTMKLGTKTDVYSFGILMLELFTGRKAVDVSDSDNIGILSWVTSLKDEYAALDPTLPLRGNDRPTMSFIASSLEKSLSIMLEADNRSEGYVEDPLSPR